MTKSNSEVLVVDYEDWQEAFLFDDESLCKRESEQQQSGNRLQ